jgi:hypothetical protein
MKTSILINSRHMRIVLFTAFLLLPFTASASIPAFPMAFWGTATIDDALAPEGAVIRAYYGSTVAGEVTVEEDGTYGYTDPTKQKLVVQEGEGQLVFTIQSPAFNDGDETGGNASVTHAGFTSGETVEKELSFTISSETSDDSGGGSSNSSGEGGGSSSGGGGSSKSKSSSQEQVLGVSTTTSDQTIELQKQIIAILTQLIGLLQQKLLLFHTAQ